MRIIDQTLDDVTASLSPLDVEWMDDLAANAIAKLSAMPKKADYTRSDIVSLLNRVYFEKRSFSSSGLR